MYHITEKEHKKTEVLVSQDQVTGIDYQITSKKRTTLANSRNS